MHTVLVVIYLLIVIALVGVVLIQRSEGGGLGIGGGSGFMTARGTKNALTRLTAILALCFFVMSIVLVVVGNVGNSASYILNRIPNADGSVNSNGNAPSILEQLGGTATPSTDDAKPAPTSESPIPLPQLPVSSDVSAPVAPEGVTPKTTNAPDVQQSPVQETAPSQ